MASEVRGQSVLQSNWLSIVEVGPPTFKDRAIVKRIRPIPVMSFLLLAVCGAFCQSERPSADLLQGAQYDGPDQHEVQGQELHTSKSLPDAPSAQPPTQAEKFRTFVDEARSPL